MKKLWLLLVSVLMLAACSDDIPEVPTPEVDPRLQGRTMLAYIVSNNSGGDLDDYLKYNVVDMYKGLTSLQDSSVLLIYYRPKNYDKSLKGPSILKFVADGKGKINGLDPLPASALHVSSNFSNVQDVANLVIGQAEVTPSENRAEIATDPKVMSRVLKTMTEMVPSTSYGLAMGSHGTGWLEANLSVARSFGDDQGFNINIPELAATLKEAFEGQQLDFLLFDACMMANAEVAYELREVTHYMIASVLETPVYGFPYSRIFQTLYADQVDYQHVCDQFVALSREKDLWGTCSVTDCTQMDELAKWVKDGLAANADGLTAELPAKVIQYGRRPSFNNYSFDVTDLFRQLTGAEPAALKELMNKVVVAKNCIEDNGSGFPYVVIDKNRYSGLGMYLPYLVNKSKWDTFYMSALAWPKAIEWNYKL